MRCQCQAGLQPCIWPTLLRADVSLEPFWKSCSLERKCFTLKAEAAKKDAFGDHAKNKLVILERHGFVVGREKIEAIARNPDRVLQEYGERKIAQGPLEDARVGEMTPIGGQGGVWI